MGIPRGGSSKEEEDENDEEGDEDEDEDSSASVEPTTVDLDAAADNAEIDGVQIELNVEKYDEPWAPSPFSNLYISLGVMVLARKIDLFNPTVVRLARFAFISYLILQQLFLLYVRIQAKINNDRTPIQLKNPLSSLVQNQLANANGGGIMKDLASSFLSSSSTVLEYDLKQALNMQSGLIFNMLFMWFLHFKMQQVQPLIIQTANGLQSMVYSPLFQIYVLGRNLKRPFENPALNKAVEEREALSKEEEADDTPEPSDVDDEGTVNDEEDDEGDEAEKDEDDDDSDERATSLEDADEGSSEEAASIASAGDDKDDE
jgi:Phosphate transport (Pho88)